MITVSIYKNKAGDMTGFRLEGHAGYAESGSDIVCAAVSALVLTAMESIHEFTSDRFTYDGNDDGLVDFNIISNLSESSKLLINSLILGLTKIQEEYGKKYIRFQ